MWIEKSVNPELNIIRYTLVSGAQGQAHTCQHSSTFFFLKKTLICSNQANLPVSLTLVQMLRYF